MRLLRPMLEAVKAVRALCAPAVEGIAYEVEHIVCDELIGAVATELIIEYGQEQALRVLHAMCDSDIDYDEFINAVRQYRAPIQGDDEPIADWEWVFYALLWLTEPHRADS